jgi:hypothetical protein
MGLMMDEREDKIDEQLRQAAQDYHRPPEPPREAMWAAIQRRRAEPKVIPLRPWLRWGLGIAAVLALGIGIGRWSIPGTAARPTTTIAERGDTAPRASMAYQVAATQYLSRTEALLTGFRADGMDPQLVTSARELLETTRLMLDSPAAQDPRLRALLEDLELVLAQIAQLPQGRGAEEMNLITQGLEQRGVMPRLRTAIPAGQAAAPAQGAL